jgi:hypothetical protein
VRGECGADGQVETLRVHEQAGSTSVELAAALARLDAPDPRIDVIRTVWQAQMDHAQQLADGLLANLLPA